MRLLLSLLVAGLSACSNLSFHSSLSEFAPRYVLELRLRSKKTESNAIQGWGVLTLYQNQFSKAFYSQCQNYPGDSNYLAILLQQDCVSRPYALFSTIGRLLREHDLPLIHPSSPVLESKRLRWIDFPRPCLKEGSP
ncbi:MAG: hypothetical protein KA436_06515 [Oligoflexales bacterium]|nr:hypothetical protein [Oligoflexales bacterium]